MTIEKDILRLLSKNETAHYEILSQLKDRYDGSEIGLSVTKLNKEMKIHMSNETKSIYKITDLGTLELRSTVIRFCHNNMTFPSILIIIGIVVTFIIGLLNYFK